MFDALIQDASLRYGVGSDWIRAVIDVESNFNPDAFNPNDPGGAYGLMQIIAATARGYGVTDLSTLFDPAVNIDVGTHLLSDLQALYGKDFRRVYSAYNSGDPDAWETSSEVRANVQRALEALGRYAVAGGSIILVVVGALFYIGRRRR